MRNYPTEADTTDRNLTDSCTSGLIHTHTHLKSRVYAPSRLMLTSYRMSRGKFHVVAFRRRTVVVWEVSRWQVERGRTHTDTHGTRDNSCCYVCIDCSLTLIASLVYIHATPLRLFLTTFAPASVRFQYLTRFFCMWSSPAALNFHLNSAWWPLVVSWLWKMVKQPGQRHWSVEEIGRLLIMILVVISDMQGESWCMIAVAYEVNGSKLL